MSIKFLRVEAAQFKRKNSDEPWEDGVVINGGRLIIDLNGNVVAVPIWTWRERGDFVMTVHQTGGSVEAKPGRKS